jgi:mobilome CxxCx(11)CxxC protein
LTDLESIRRQCWDEALHCFGTSYIFEVRANLLRRRIRLLTFLGIALPASVGATFAAYGAESRITIILAGLAGALGLIQLLGSVWSLTNRWDDDFGYALESLSANRVLSDRFRSLGQSPPATVEEARTQYRLIDTESKARALLDDKQGITDEERRMGMRAALRQFKRDCAGCNKIPTSMEPTNCAVCGNFKMRRI